MSDEMENRYILLKVPWKKISISFFKKKILLSDTYNFFYTYNAIVL